MEWGRQDSVLDRPVYYYALILFALLGLAKWRITQSHSACICGQFREMPARPPMSACRFSDAARRCSRSCRLWRHRGTISRHHGIGRPRIGLLDPFGEIWFSWPFWRQWNIRRPAIGALVFVVLQDFVMSITQYWPLCHGGVLVLLVVFSARPVPGTIEALVNRRNGGR